MHQLSEFPYHSRRSVSTARSRILGIISMAVCLIIAQPGTANAYVLFPYKFQVSTAQYFLEYTVTAHSSWPGYIASYAPVWKNAESASPTLSRTYDSAYARIYVYQGNLQNPTWCGQAVENTSGGTINYANYGYAQSRIFGTSGSGSQGCDLIDTTIHELGHNLGINHSTTSGALMAGLPSVPKHGLHWDDVDAIRARY